MVLILSKRDLNLIRRALNFLKPYKFKFIYALLCIFIGIVLGLIQPLIWGNLLTKLFSGKYKEIQIFILYLSVLYSIQLIFSFLQSYLFSYLNENIIYDLKTSMYDKILNLPVVAFDKLSVGDFLSRLHDDTTTISNIITNQLLNMIVDLIKVIIIGIFVFKISIPLAGIVLLAFPLTYGVLLKFSNILKEKNRLIRKLYDGYFSQVQETISGIREVKSLGIKDDEIKTFSKLSFKMKLLSININIIASISNSISQMISFILQIVIYSLGAYLIFRGLLKIEYFIAFTSYSQQFSSSLNNITRLNSNIQKAVVSIERIFGLIDSLDYSQEVYGTRDIKRVKGNIIFDNVIFNYSENQQVLKGISFDIKPNKKYSIVGSSGGGKTTIFNLLLRFYDPSSGKITLDGIDLKEFNETSLRKHISIVRQDPLLFNLSIKDNLLLANSNATIVEIQHACKAAFIHDFIISLPKGYDSMVADNGVNFSGGQKQRIAIARTILKKSKIILFDEATSSLDNESQYEIKKAIDNLSVIHTVIIIAHRLLNVIDSDEIFVVDEGKIVAQGNHKFLIEKNNVYKRLYRAEIDALNDS